MAGAQTSLTHTGTHRPFLTGCASTLASRPTWPLHLIRMTIVRAAPARDHALALARATPRGPPVPVPVPAPPPSPLHLSHGPAVAHTKVPAPAHPRPPLHQYATTTYRRLADTCQAGDTYSFSETYLCAPHYWPFRKPDLLLPSTVTGCCSAAAVLPAAVRIQVQGHHATQAVVGNAER